MSAAAFFFAGRALITLAGLCAFGLIVRELQIYADKALNALFTHVEVIDADRP